MKMICRALFGAFFIAFFGTYAAAQSPQNRAALQAQTNTQITTNGKGQITGAILNDLLSNYIQSMGNVADTNTWAAQQSFSVYPLVLGAPTALHVANNAALSTLVGTTQTVVHRDGFAAAGDGGGVDYTWQAGACPLNFGLGDLGSQIPGPSGCYIASFGPGQQNAAIWGVLPGSTDIAPNINAALASGYDINVATPGNYPLVTNWVNMTLPKQKMSCAKGVTFTAQRAGFSAAPALIMNQPAVGAKVEECYVDHNGAQFIGSAFAPLNANNVTYYDPSTGLVNNYIMTAATIGAGGSGYGSNAIGTLTWSAAGCAQNPILNVQTSSSGTINNIISLKLEGGCSSGILVPGTTWTPGGGLSAGTGASITPTVQELTATDDGFAVGVLVMCDECEFNNNWVTNGFDDDIFVVNFNLTTGAQTGASPFRVKMHHPKTSFAGSGAHSWTPNFYTGIGIDVGTGVQTQIDNGTDYFSRIGFGVDEGGGASANMENMISYFAQMTPAPFTTAGKMSSYYPLLSDPWHGSSISGTGYFWGGSNRSALTGQMFDGLLETTCTNCVAYEPQGVGMWFSRFSSGVHLISPKVYKPGLECYWVLAGTHYAVDPVCDQPNALKATVPSNQPGWAGLPWPQTPAYNVFPANAAPFVTTGSLTTGPVASQTGVSGAIAVFSPEQINTTLNLDGPVVRGPSALDTPSTPNWSYSLVTNPAYTTGATGTSSSAQINVRNPNIQPGAIGLEFDNPGSPIYIQPNEKISNPTLSGTCTGLGSPSGSGLSGAFVGSFAAANACTAGTVIISFAYNAPHGWACSAEDTTTPANLISQQSWATFAATLKATVTAGDVLTYSCSPF